MRRRMPHSESGQAPVGWQDIQAFCRLTGTHLSPQDVELIEAIDDLYLAHSVSSGSDADKQQRKKDSLLALGKR